MPITFTEFIKFAAAVGLGGLLVKILDIIWLQKNLENSEQKKWLREQRLRVYSELSKELMALGKHYGTREDPFKGYSFVGEALLLVDDEKLGKQLEQFFTQLSNLYKKCSMEKPDVPEKELDEAYEIVFQNSRNLVVELRKSLQRA